MDPYLEDPYIWPDVHQRLAIVMSEDLNKGLPRPYYARTEMRPELSIADESSPPHGGRAGRRIVPDVLILKRPRFSTEPTSRAVAVAEPRTARSEVSPAIEFGSLSDEPLRHYFVEVRDSKRGHELVTLIEILSPSNKQPGPDRDAYLAKQREVLETGVNLVEIDLLRAGQRPLPNPELEEAVELIDPPPDYLVLVSRAWRRTEPMLGYLAYPGYLREWLPCFGVPLRAELPEVPLDLQFVFGRVYDTGPYLLGAVDYELPLDPPLTEEDAVWARTQLAAAKG